MLIDESNPYNIEVVLQFQSIPRTQILDGGKKKEMTKNTFGIDE